jgi:hypothetical protein
MYRVQSQSKTHNAYVISTALEDGRHHDPLSCFISTVMDTVTVLAIDSIYKLVTRIIHKYFICSSSSPCSSSPSSPFPSFPSSSPFPSFLPLPLLFSFFQISFRAASCSIAQASHKPVVLQTLAILLLQTPWCETQV